MFCKQTNKFVNLKFCKYYSVEIQIEDDISNKFNFEEKYYQDNSQYFDIMEGSMNLLSLPDDILLTIFEYLSDEELGTLCKTSKFLSDFIGYFILTKRLKGLPMVGVGNPKVLSERMHENYTTYEHFCMAKNWLSGKYIESGYAYRRHSVLYCKLQLDKHFLYVSNGCDLDKYERLFPVKRYPRIRSDNDALERKRSFEMHFPDQIVDYMKRNGTMFLARAHGVGTVVDNGIPTEIRLHAVQERMLSVHFRKDIFATSSDSMVKIWRRYDELGLLDLELMYAFNEKSYRGMILNDNASVLFGGSSSLSEVNIETGQMQNLSENINDIMSITLKDEQLLFMVNRSSMLQMYDRRTNHLEFTTNLTGNKFICMDHDGCNGIVCGSQTNGVVALFDCRKWNAVLQTYTVNCITQQGISDVFSVVCDNRYCFTAVRNHVHVFDFKTEN